MFGGTSGGAMILAGGANFPHGPPWAGGKKVWHDAIFAFVPETGAWVTCSQRLPSPRAMGVSLTTPDGVICVGGGDAERHYADAFLLRWKEPGIETVSLPALPVPLANACGAVIGSIAYVAGGSESPTATVASKRVFSLDLAAKDAGWRELDPLPG